MRAYHSLTADEKVGGLKKGRDYGSPHAFISGFGFNDHAHDCDCKPIQFIEVSGKDDPSNGNHD